MKPSEAIMGGAAEGQAEILEKYHGRNMQLESLLAHLDAEYMRRSYWEARVERRLGVALNSPNFYRDADRRYREDSTFHAVVSVIESMALEHGYTPWELKQAAFKAALNIEERRVATVVKL